MAKSFPVALPGASLEKSSRLPLDPRQTAHAVQRFEYLVGFLICQFNFVHQVLSIMLKTPTNSLSTMGVSVSEGARFNLFFNPAFCEELTDSEMTYVFYHEILHLVLHHCTLRRFNDHRLGNVAADLAVNDLIPVSSQCVPPTNKKTGELIGVHVKEFKKIKLFRDIKEKMNAEWYYDYLQQKQKEDPNNPVWSYYDSFDNHDGWKEDELGDERVRAKVNEIDKMDTWGDVSEGMKQIILASQIRRINWRNQLMSLYGILATNERFATRKRPNRRTEYVHPGYRKHMVDRHLIAIDTSGSTEPYLEDFLAVMNQLIDYVPIDLMMFDCEKQSEPRPYTRKKVQFEFKGLGGTDFEPVMKVVNEKKYRSVAIVTDGCAPAPSKPLRARVTWVMPVGCKAPVDWGKKIYIEKRR